MALNAKERGMRERQPAFNQLQRHERAVFLDKDGTLVENIPYNVNPDHLKLTPRATEGLRMMQEMGYRLIVVTNQSGLARGLFDRPALNQYHAILSLMLQQHGITIDDYFVCPHMASMSISDPGCLCRKPAPGLLRQAALIHRIDLANSWMIGDILNDVEAGHRAGCRSILMEVGNETEWHLTPIRTPEYQVSNLFEAAQVIARCESRQAKSALWSERSTGKHAFADSRTESR